MSKIKFSLIFSFIYIAPIFCYGDEGITNVILGDAVLTQQQYDYLSGKTTSRMRSGAGQVTTDGAYGFSQYGTGVWPGGSIPIKFDSSTYIPGHGFSLYRNYVFSACADWGQTARIDCRDATASDTQWLLVTNKSDGCYATVGFTNKHPRYMNLDFYGGCLDDGVVRHELGHVIGMMHEHQRPNRDKNIRINWENIRPEYHYAYQRLSNANKTTTYDIYSIMHYASSSFSTGAGPTYRGVGLYAGISNEILKIRRTVLTGNDRSLAVQVYGSRYVAPPPEDECSNLPPGYYCP